jgi:hypothetical protein
MLGWAGVRRLGMIDIVDVIVRIRLVVVLKVSWNNIFV